MGDICWVVKNPETMKYFQFGDPQWQLIEMFDGTRSRSQIVEAYNRRAGSGAVDLPLILEFEESLRKMNLIEQSVAERNLNLLDKFKTLRRRTAEEKSEGFNIFFIMFHVLDPERFLQRTVKYVRWIWTPPVVIVTTIASLWTISVFVRNWEPIWAGTLELYKFFGKPLPDILQFFFILCIIGAIHEFGHAYAVKVYGGEVHDIGVALFYFTPVFYCDTADSFMFSNKWQRLWVVLTGIYVEAIVCSAATATWVFTYPDSLLNQAAYKTMLLTGFATVFFNINPLIKVDGYYALASVLELPDLREGSFRYLGALLQKFVLRLPVDIPEMTRRKRFLYCVYGILSMSYTASIMLLIAGALSNFYNKYFPDMAIILLLLTLNYIFRKRVRVLTRTAKLLYLDKKELLMSARGRLPLAAAGAVVLLLLFVPWSRRTLATDVNLEPFSRAQIQAPREGIVSEVLVHEGDSVNAGQPLFLLTSAATAEEGQRLTAQREMAQEQSRIGQQTGNAALAYQADQRSSSVQEALHAARVRREELTVRSPIFGRVLSPRPEDLAGRYVIEGSSLAEVGDCRQMVADIGISERFLEYLHPGAPVIALVQTRLARPAHGSVVRISSATMEQPATASAGREPAIPSSRPDRFVASTAFDNPDGRLLPGATAKIKLYGVREAYAVRAWRGLWRWIRTLLW